jgi:hypothetical protein
MVWTFRAGKTKKITLYASIRVLDFSPMALLGSLAIAV